MTVSLGEAPTGGVVRLRNQAPGDRWDHAFSLGQPDGDTLAGVPVITVQPTGLTIEAPAIVAGRVVAWISGGVAGTDYRLSVTCATARGLLLAKVAALHVGAVGLDDPTAIGGVS